MKVLVFEYITGGGLENESLPISLAREGEVMLLALLHDLLEVPDVQPVAMRDSRLPMPAELNASVEWVTVPPGSSWRECFLERLDPSDAVWPIAPETGGLLESLCSLVEAAGKPLLTSPAAAVRIAAGKLATQRRLDAAGISTVPTFPWNFPGLHYPLVVKPDDGVGCENARILADAAAREAWLAATSAPEGYVLQPLLEGEALSLSVLFAHGESRLLSVNRQHIARRDHGFVLRGCAVNAIRDFLGPFHTLAAQVARAMPELWGYAGIDLLRNERGLPVLEVNPRLTTSYAGIRPATGWNPAASVLALRCTGNLPPIPAGQGGCVDIGLESLEHGD